MALRVLQGRAGSAGAGMGRLVRVRTTHNGEPTGAGSSPPRVESAERPREQERLRRALEHAGQELAQLAEETRTRAGPDVAAIFEAQALFVRDPALVEPALAAIADAGLGAVEAITLASADQADTLARLEDEYFRARAADIRDVGKRVVGILEGRPRPDLHTSSGDPAVLASDDLDASIVAELRPELVAGVALAGGAPTGHAAIVARALGIPLALGLGDALLSLPEGEEVIVDGTLGRVLVAPNSSERLAAGRANGLVRLAPAPGLAPLTLPVII